MYRISELASLVGLSRTALLYYEKLNLISGKRLDNGYRVYDDKDLQQVRLIQHLQNGGLSLAQCKSCLESKLDKSVLSSRYEALKKEIEQKQRSLNFLAGLLGKETSKPWHETLSEIAPDAHLDWLKIQGFDEKQALRIKWLSKDMNEHEQYMQDFLTVFEGLEYWGPGSKEDTQKAFESLNFSPTNILEIGCGNGNATLHLANLSDAQITATDNEQSALDRLKTKVVSRNLSSRISTRCISMTELDFAKHSFDVIWAEASMYVMGVEKALSAWKPLLRPNGFMVFSDLVWLTDTPSQNAMEFWKGDYPDMQTVEVRLSHIEKAGYNIVNNFTISEQAWRNYYEPLEARIAEVRDSMRGSQAIADIQKELDLYQRCLGEFGYQFFIAETRVC